MILASLFKGFLTSNAIGQGIVIFQILGSIVMVATIFGKWKELAFVTMATRRFRRDVESYTGVLEYYLQRRPTISFGIEGIYKSSCERLLKLLNPDVRSLVAGRENGAAAAALSAREIELVRGACEHALDEEEIRVEKGMGLISTVVALEPMLGLLGTVWGVLDAFDVMGDAGSASLATIAPSISSALVTTVIGLIIAIPGVVFFNMMNAQIRNIMADLEGFADDLTGRIACEFQGRGA